MLKSGVRTKTNFFIDTLRIRSGKPFNLDLDRWNAIQRSGLFKNLTAEAIPIGKNEVALRISGVELPSIRFAPEISVAASIDRPEVSGGVSYDRKQAISRLVAIFVIGVYLIDMCLNPWIMISVLFLRCPYDLISKIT